MEFDESKKRELSALLRSGTADDIRNHYLERVRAGRTDADAALRCELLDLSWLGKDVVRSLRALRRTADFSECGGLYFQANPQQGWALSVGALPKGISGAAGLGQEVLFSAQHDVFRCRCADEAAGIFRMCVNTPWEQSVQEFVWSYTAAEIWSALQKAKPEISAAFAGIAHSGIWMELAHQSDF